jgi:hypothetical protein
MAHITNNTFGNFSLARLVTSPSFGVEPFSTYADPVLFRLSTNTNQAGNFEPPFPLGSSEMFSLDFTSVGLVMGNEGDLFGHLMETALPTYFNLLNLGKICSATADSDSHAQIREPLGSPRNYVISSVDPQDGSGSYSEISEEELAVNVNAGKVIISSGIFLKTKLSSAENPSGVTVGGTLAGTGEVSLEIAVSSIEYIDWDTVEIYANTEPVPAKDDLGGVTDLSSPEFHSVSQGHITKYLMAPIASYHKGIGGEFDLKQSVSAGVRQAVIRADFSFSEDTWIVVLVKGSHGVRSMFPLVTRGVTVPAAKDSSAPTAVGNFLNTLDTDPVQIGGLRAFALSNPMFVDVDGNGFEAIYIRDGTSPLAD